MMKNNIITRLLKNLGDKLIVKNHEPQIEQKRDRHGIIYWQVYDFATNKSYTFGSEQEVRSWIEHRHHFSKITGNSY